MEKSSYLEETISKGNHKAHNKGYR